MSNDLMIPDKADVPAHIRNPELAKQANEDASAGISTGFPARIKISAKQFVLVDGNGEEKPFPPTKMVHGPDENVYLPVIILRAKKALSKSWYLKAYNPNEEGVSPDCFSNDSERPDASVAAPQCDTCAACPHNAWGSGKDQEGNATKGKACTDMKMLAAFVPNFGVHSFKLPPASLKNFGLYVKQLSAAGIPLGTVKTLVGFDLAETYPILIFRFGGYLPEAHMDKITELAASEEAEDAIGGITASTPSAPQLNAPSEEAKTPEVINTPDDDMGLGDVPATKESAPQKETAPTETTTPTNQELMDELGL